MEDIGILRRWFGPAHLRIGDFAAAWGSRLSALDPRACFIGFAFQDSCDSTGSTGSMGTENLAALVVNSPHQRNRSAKRCLVEQSAKVTLAEACADDRCKCFSIGSRRLLSKLGANVG
jgi:hypothetical protein